MVALLLPLSSLWAGMTTDTEKASLNLFAGSASHSGRALLRKSSAAASTGAQPCYSPRKTSSASHGPLAHLVESGFGEFERKVEMDLHHPASVDTVIRASNRSGTLPTKRDSTELDLEAMGVRVDKSFSVRKGSQTSL